MICILTCQTDLFSTCADIVGATPGKSQGVDSESILPAFQGSEVTFTRKGIINHSVSGHFAYREGNHKLILAYGSGGWTAPKEDAAKKNKAPKAQLYDLSKDPGETQNLYLKNKELADQMLKQLTDYVYKGSSVEGKESKNDVDDSVIELWKTK